MTSASSLSASAGISADALNAKAITSPQPQSAHRPATAAPNHQTYVRSLPSPYSRHKNVEAPLGDKCLRSWACGKLSLAGRSMAASLHRTKVLRASLLQAGNVGWNITEE